jgi:hypothetical protein
MRQSFQRGYLRCTRRKSGPDCWEFLWREYSTSGKPRHIVVVGQLISSEATADPLRQAPGRLSIPHFVRRPGRQASWGGGGAMWLFGRT